MTGPVLLLSRLLLSLSTALPAGLLAAAPTALPDQDGPFAQPGVVYNGPVVNVNNAVREYPSAPASAPQAMPTPAPAPSAAWTGVAPVQTEAIPHYQAPLYPEDDPHQRGLSLGGPRLGVSYVNGGGFDKMQETVRKAKPDYELDPFMTQFGWQVEYRMFRTSKGMTALTEFIPLVGGMDQGLALPSATWLVGLRMRNGFEFGMGPNVGLNGAGMMAGVGFTVDMGGINIPLNLAAGRGAYQTTSVAFSTGFNL